MRNSEETHILTENIYKGLSENFNPGLRQILLCGKVYHKALLSLNSAAKAYSEALLRVGGTARSTCKGGTEDIGESIYQIAEAHKEIQTRVEENTKALFTELILPLELKLEHEYKRVASQHKKYTHGHKAVWSPYSKACDSLKKFRKKSKNKMVYDDQKEGQYLKTLDRCQNKLEEFRVNGLKLALLEERKCHCFLLDRLNSVVSLYANHHKQTADTLLSGMPRWKQLAAKPHILPPEAERLLMLPEDVGGYDYVGVNGGVYRNGYLPEDSRSVASSPYKRSQSVHEVYRRPLGPTEYSGMPGDYRTLPAMRGMTAPPPPPPTTGLQVRAVYNHTGEGDSKLSFSDGDVINIIGDKSMEGWQYGLNTRSGKYGWFPLSFTEPLNIPPPQEPAPVLSNRVKSMGDLQDSRSMLEGMDFHIEQDVPGNVRRPKSLYEGPGNQPYRHYGWQGSTANITNSSNMIGSYSLPRHFSGHGSFYSSDNDRIYQFMSPDRQPPTGPQSETSGHVSYQVPQPGSIPAPPPPPSSNTASPPPPPPPPPPPASIPQKSSLKTPTHSAPTRTPSSSNLTVFNPSMILESPVLRRKASMRKLNSDTSSSSTPTQPPAQSHPGTSNTSTISNLSQNRDSGMLGNGTQLRQQHSNPPPPPPPTLGGVDRNQPPTTRPPAPPIMGDHPDIDYGGEVEEDTNFRRNPSFANVNLKRTVTNDRSAPRI